VGRRASSTEAFETVEVSLVGDVEEVVGLQQRCTASRVGGRAGWCLRPDPW
jgi:hypothetical protein